MHLRKIMAWYNAWSLIVLDLHNHTNAARQPQRAMKTVLCKRPPTTSNNLYRGLNCCTTHIAKTTVVFSSHDCIFHVEQSPERVPTDWYFLFYACSVDMLPLRSSPLRRSHPCLSPTYTTSSLCLKADLNFFVRPSGARLHPQHIAKECCCA